MKYIANVRNLLEGKETSGNALEHELSEIVQEVTSQGACTRDFIVMNNAYFRFFDEFKPDWRQEMNKFCAEFNLVFSVGGDSTVIEFRKKET